VATVAACGPVIRRTRIARSARERRTGAAAASRWRALAGGPGDPCVDGITFCDGANALGCGGLELNACGGRAELPTRPGATCGACSDGVAFCAGPDTVACTGGTPVVARPRCSPLGSGLDPTDEVFAQPLDRLQCTGEDSTAEGGTVVEYNWTLVARPPGSSARPSPETAETTSVFLDAAGNYELSLNIVDNRGCVSEPASVHAIARSDDDIMLQLTWRTPADPDETDAGAGAGADIDLHLLHPNGCWEDRTWDCHFRAANPNWGDVARADDDPSVDIDDTDGAGPEVISLNNPESGLTYLVGVNYWDDHGFGRSDATLRVYVFGELVFEQTRTLTASGQWWVPASVAWPSGGVVPVDVVSDGVPVCD